MATKAPAWTFATSLAGIADNEGDIVNAGVKAGVVLGTRVGSVTSGNRFVTTGMWGIGTVVGEAMMGIVWAIDASGGISPKCAGPEVGGPMGVRSPWGGYRIPSSLYNYYEMCEYGAPELGYMRCGLHRVCAIYTYWYMLSHRHGTHGK